MSDYYEMIFALELLELFFLLLFHVTIRVENLNEIVNFETIKFLHLVVLDELAKLLISYL